MDGQQDFAALIALLVEATSQYLIHRSRPAPRSCSCSIPGPAPSPTTTCALFSLEPTRQIVANVRAVHPEIPIILFPRGVGAGYLDFAEAGVFAALSLDQSVPLAWARDQLQPQGRPARQSRPAAAGRRRPAMRSASGIS